MVQKGISQSPAKLHTGLHGAFSAHNQLILRNDQHGLGNCAILSLFVLQIEFLALQEAGSPAEKAGLKKGDIIVALGEENTGSLAEFRYELYKYEVGEKVEVTYYRDNKIQKTVITLGKPVSQ